LISGPAFPPLGETGKGVLKSGNGKEDIEKRETGKGDKRLQEY